MILNRLAVFRGKRILMLQGPVGPFFYRLAKDLENAGATTFQLNFNGGDWLFSRRSSLVFRGSPDEWSGFFERLLDRLDISTVFLFGDCRAYHRTAREIAALRGVDVRVFEEGYVRPDYVTFERFGVNGHSQLPRSPTFYIDTPVSEVAEPRPVGNAFWYAALWATLYYIASAALRPWFRHYRHHRPLTICEVFPWARSLWRKAYYKVTERASDASLGNQLSGRYFLVPLQTYTDAQIDVHSSFDSVAAFAGFLMRSFARHAPADTVLVFKHHPLDRGYRDYTRLIRKQAGILQISDRVIYIHDQHLPTLLKRARGVVVINTTVGISALHHEVPTKVCGIATYDLPGLTFQGSLDAFWTAAPHCKVNRVLYERFRRHVISATQLNGSFYRRLDIPGSCAGLVWSLGTPLPQTIQAEGIASLSRRAQISSRSAVQQRPSERCEERRLGEV